MNIEQLKQEKKELQRVINAKKMAIAAEFYLNGKSLNYWNLIKEKEKVIKKQKKVCNEIVKLILVKDAFVFGAR